MEFPVLSLTGNMLVNIIIDPDTAPANIIKETDSFIVDVACQITGVGLLSLGGDFRFEVFAESFGPQPEVSLGSQSVNVSAGIGTPMNKMFTTQLNVGAGTLQPGVYRLVTVLTHSNLGQPTNIVGFEEGPTIQVYTPHPLLP